MQVILLEKIHSLGNVMDIVDVADGYARNYLLRRKKVLRATKKNKEFVERERLSLEQKNEELKIAAEQNAVAISNNAKINILRQASDDGKLYGSVSVGDIIQALFQATGVKVISENIILDKKIKQIGVFNVKVMLHPDVSLYISLDVLRSDQ